MFNHWIHKKLANDKYKVILCSSSPRRLDILKQLGINPIVEKSTFEEDFDKNNFDEPIDYVQATAREKLKDVVNRINSEKTIYLSADTVIICNNKIFEKPLTIEQNITMLKELFDLQRNGESIKIVTCCCLYNSFNEKTFEFNETSLIKLSTNLSDLDIIEYCKSGEGLEVAGGFKIQGFGMILFESIQGDFYNCVGLPGRLVFEKIGEIIKT
ncbi:hypothetical protein CANINC_003908 [Pichia inconspicua]|uniref:Septum formation protein Maf n=1 Tax=Pichia inconspicua TaxID=52247 RepID=A0A4T0WXI4_9ASCO|nr:hypothetical protein CANINC_003908 [[Candida] inconspicua]